MSARPWDPVRAPTRGGLARVQGWKEQGWSPWFYSCLSSPRAALGVPADRRSWAAGPVAELKLDPVPYVGYQGQLRSRPGCSQCPPAQSAGRALVPGCLPPYRCPPQTAQSLLQPQNLALHPLAWCYHGAEARDPAPSPCSVAPKPCPCLLRSFSKQHLASLDRSPSSSLAPPLPALIRSELGGRVST